MEDIKYVLRAEGVPTHLTIVADAVKRTTNVSPKNFDRHLKKSIHHEFLRSVDTDDEPNDAKVVTQNIVPSDTVASKLSNTFYRIGGHGYRNDAVNP